MGFLVQSSGNRFVLKEIRNTKSVYSHIPKKKEFPFYPKIGALFAQGLIKKVGFNYYYKNILFESTTQLAEYIKSDILKTPNSVKQYVNDTIMETGTKNIYGNLNMMRKTIIYCKDNEHIITEEFTSRYNALLNWHHNSNWCHHRVLIYLTQNINWCRKFLRNPIDRREQKNATRLPTCGNKTFYLLIPHFKQLTPNRHWCHNSATFNIKDIWETLNTSENENRIRTPRRRQTNSQIY